MRREDTRGSGTDAMATVIMRQTTTVSATDQTILDTLAGDPAADRGAGRLLEDDRDAALALAQIATALTSEHGIDNSCHHVVLAGRFALRVGKANPFRPRRQRHGFAWRQARRRRRAQRRAAALDNQLAVLATAHHARQEVGLADERRDKAVARPVVQVLRRADLRDQSLVHHRHAVRHGQRLFLIVRDIDERDTEISMQPSHFELKALAQLLVECAQRLIHQQQPRVEHDRAGQRDALLLTAGKLARISGLIARQTHQLEALRHQPGTRGAIDAALLQREADVVRDRQMREQCVVLEHHADVALVRRQRHHRASVDGDVAGGRRFKAGDHHQRRGLAGAAWSKQRQELAGADVERDAPHRADVVESLLDAGQDDGRALERCGLSGSQRGGSIHVRPGSTCSSGRSRCRGCPPTIRNCMESTAT